MAAAPPKRGTTASDGTIVKKPRTNLSMVAQQFTDAHKTAYISLKNNPPGWAREPLARRSSRPQRRARRSCSAAAGTQT
eukprot:3529201-Prymnesium_polylepis.1